MAGQITLRPEDGDERLVAQIREAIFKQSRIKPRDADVYRAIFHAGCEAMLQHFNVAPEPEPSAAESERVDYDPDPFLDDEDGGEA